MCFGKQPKATTPADAPAPALEPADAPEIGESRRKETIQNFGDDAPNYRVERTDKQPTMSPSDKIVM